jgi:uracil-DNA glycosylase family 4
LEDGLKLEDLWITSVVRCAPPDNKPSTEELRNCAPYLDEELSLLKNLKVVVCLGKIALDGYLSHLVRTGQRANRSGIEFRHGGEWEIAPGKYLLTSYHPSLQNTNTGRLTKDMFLAIFDRARELAAK